MGTRRSGRVTAGLFGWMHSSGVGELADVGPGRFTGDKYIEILEEVLLPSVTALLFPEPTAFYLVQDNSPIHTCRAVKAWFQEHPQITLLPHPPKSPDLNPIEHVWAAMTKQMPTYHIHRSRDVVVANALLAWEHLRSPARRDLTAALVASMPRRLDYVIAAGGSYTNY